MPLLPFCRIAWVLLLVASNVVAVAQSRPASPPPRVALIHDGEGAESELRVLSLALAERLSVQPALVNASERRLEQELSKLDVAVILGGPGASVSPENSTALSTYIRSGAGLVLIGARHDKWPQTLPLPEI